MKIQSILLGLLLSSAATFAQSLEKSFNAMNVQYKQNPYAYVKAHFAPDVRFIAGHSGEFLDFSTLIIPDAKVEDSQFTDLKLFESGDWKVVAMHHTKIEYK